MGPWRGVVFWRDSQNHGAVRWRGDGHGQSRGGFRFFGLHENEGWCTVCWLNNASEGLIADIRYASNNKTGEPRWYLERGKPQTMGPWNVVSRWFLGRQAGITDGLGVCLCMAIYSGLPTSEQRQVSL